MRFEVSEMLHNVKSGEREVRRSLVEGDWLSRVLCLEMRRLRARCALGV